MKKFKFTLVAASLVAVLGCQEAPSQNATSDVKAEQSAAVVAPVAEKIPHKTTIHGQELVDNYHWLRDDTRSNEKVLSHLTKENAYTDSKLVNTEQLQQTLFEEIKNKVVKDDRSVPVLNGSYYYFSATEGDKEYFTYYRSEHKDGKNAEAIFDANIRAEGQNYYGVGGISVSTNENLLAFAEDTVSRRIYTIRIKDLTTGKLLDDTIEGASGPIVWANDNKTIYYIKKDPVTLLGYQVFRHTLGTAQSTDELIYEEKDNSYYTYISKSKDKSKIYIHHSSTEASGVSLLDADNAKATPERFIPRESGHEYSIAKLGDWYYIHTNKGAVNFKLMRVKASDASDISKWQTVVPHNADAKLDSFELFNQHLVYETRENGLSQITVLNLDNNESKRLTFNDPAYAVYLTGNANLDAGAVRIGYQSMTTPASVYDVDLASLDKTLLKQDKVLGDFAPENYQSERIFITARDGIKVPVSIVYRKDKFKQDGSNPLLQYGYGSYGSNVEPTFSISRLSLLDRGFVYAIAHIRGSETLGRPWYDNGKKLNKKNTFNDFVDVTKALVEQKYGDASRIYARGGSAGGLLMGAVINQAPELYDGVHAAVPFVDVINTMLDETLPLTTNEYDEWGNPNEKTYFDYMLSYSPYDQVKAQAYPNLLVTTGLHDSQVQYFEPAKWVAKLREYKTDDNLLLLKTDMEAGHGGASGRFKRIHDVALSYSFFIALAENKL
ncbi:S9 family peptidase [Pseudoalteromonas sp. L23]|uniref:S9 family peptidase n=1 Tax=unclassified Pseudoalteromonas TaxID=194690 RepID=UPI001F1EDCE7|nr:MULTISPECIES: S9 family peptidase [unclassified Pseudoalteromonas]MCF2827284.1 S9 family peptidase [Pseudoalteromonas sp. OF5H-5]MCF2833672.1 S9 family peptidase [Pseudoalteromonas sp. DL2-H6]MCF2926442.1 S9 family peptidase [Pseudoalteromonas sp. DL2-H1]MCF7515284.1 S9 family peptidase [Pseudoalteromonas sp. L7]MCF7527186.1 S9 family peptidase [Pseudoalteromonas sp. L23]